MKTRKEQLDRHKYWENHVKSFRKSGLSQRDYCKRNNISYWSFNPWKRKIETSGILEFQQIPAEIIQSQTSGDKNIQIIIHNRLRITIPHDFSENALRKILQIVGATSEDKLV